MEWFFAFATWLDVLAISGCIGTLVCAAWVVPRHASGSLNRPLWGGFGASVALLTLASGVLLVSRTMEFSGASFASLGTYVPLVIGRTHYGLVWRWRVGAMSLLWLSWAAGRRESRSLGAEWLAGLALLVVVYSRSATGHAGDHGSFAVGVWVDMLHVLGGAVWVGTLFAMSLSVFPRLLRLEEGRDSAGAEIFGRLSTVAGIALVLIVVTGIYNAWQGLGSVNAPWHSRYGHVLAFKLVLVAWMVFLGAHNRYIKLPALHQRAGNGGRATAQGDVLGRCARSVHTESALGVCVLIAAAVLHHAMPPADVPPHPVDSSSQYLPAASCRITRCPDLESFLVSAVAGPRDSRGRSVGEAYADQAGRGYFPRVSERRFHQRTARSWRRYAARMGRGSRRELVMTGYPFLARVSPASLSNTRTCQRLMRERHLPVLSFCTGCWSSGVLPASPDFLYSRRSSV